MERITQSVSVGNLAEAADQLSVQEQLDLVRLILEREDDQKRHFAKKVLLYAAEEHESEVNIEVLSDEFLDYYELR